MDVSLAKIAQIIGGEIEGDSRKRIRAAVPFEDAKGDAITYAEGKKQIKMIGQSEAGAIIVPSSVTGISADIVRVDNPKVAFATVLRFFYPRLKPDPGIDHRAHVGHGSKCGENVSIGAMVYVGNNVQMGARVILHPGVVVGHNVTIGDDVEIFPNVTVMDRCTIGSRVTIHAGTVIGSDGFGFAPDNESYHKIPHRGIVQIDDDVEIGAGNTIDRATYGKTWIKKGVKTDNLVHIAHNVIVGENTILVAQVGIAGSATIGKHVILAGKCAIAGHISLGNNVIIGGKAGIGKSVPDGQVVSGTPGMAHRLWLRVQRVIPLLPEMKRNLDRMEKRLKQLERKQTNPEA